jgi:hypothetical protein
MTRCHDIEKVLFQGDTLILSVPSEGPHTLAGASPAMAKSQRHVAWMAGGEGNVAF